MQIDFAYILAAGKGTRMGEIGKVLPKPLWPIFEKNLLELQVLWCLSLGINKIYINASFLGDLIQKDVDRICQQYEVEIKVLHENPLLDSGGCIHNLAKLNEINYHGKLLLINSDQFYFFEDSFFKKAIDLMNIKQTPAVLFSLRAGLEDNYNETVLDNEGKLVSIEKVANKDNYLTYSGLGIIDLEKLKPVEGVSKFFESVANYKEQDVYFVTPEKSEYWDFGTSSLYAKNIKKALSTIKLNIVSDFINFLVDTKALRFEKIVSLNYESFFQNNGIDLESGGNIVSGKLKYKGIEQEF